MIAGLLLFIIYNLSEVRLQSCAAHKAAVDILSLIHIYGAS